LIQLNLTQIATNGPCACTVNAYAGLVWWFPQPLYQEIASISTITINDTQSYTLIPITDTLDVGQAILTDDVTYILTETWDDTMNQTVLNYIASTPPLPPAASTAVITISEVAQGPNSTFGADELNALYTGAPEATFAIPGASGTQWIA
jgi:hypothetical protein